MKNLKKVTKLLDECQTNPDKYFVLKINKAGSSILGISQNQIDPFSALIMKKEQRGLSIIGFFDNKHIKYSNIDGFDFSEDILIAVDCRKDTNYKVFYRIIKDDEDFEKISSNTEMTSNDSILIFWEDIQMSCMTFCNFDSERNENIREVITANNEPVKRLLRGITREFISPYIQANNRDLKEE